MKTVAVICTLFLAVSAWPDDQALVISGKGKNIEVRDASGKVEVVDPSKLRLNQIPADAAAREKAYREKVETEAADLAVRRAEEKEAAETAEKIAADAKIAEEAKQVIAADQAELLKEEQYPRKVRRNTVRGTRYIENPPPPPARETPAPNAASDEPVLSISGKKKVVAAPEPAAAPETSAPEPAPKPERSAPEPAPAPESAPAPGSEP